MNEIWKLERKKRKKKQRLKDIITSVSILICMVGVIVFFMLYYLGVKKAETFDHGSQSLVSAHPERIPEYSGEDYIILNKGKPEFNGWDLKNVYGERYTELDSIGRCGPAIARLHKNMMPEEERGNIGRIKPSGWDQEKYAGIVDSTPPYLYNRCHLIAFAMTGQNANYQNLITGTTYMNKKTMLPYEEMVLRYLDNTDNHVLYRVTPYFKDRELLARGVEMEAYSVEDKGEGICFHVFIYNVQPGIVLNYKTGGSRIEEVKETAPEDKESVPEDKETAPEDETADGS